MWRMTTEIFNHLKEGGNRINKRKWICRIHVPGSSEKFPMKFLHLYVILLQEKQR